jgi:hypothetical protein
LRFADLSEQALIAHDVRPQSPDKRYARPFKSLGSVRRSEAQLFPKVGQDPSDLCVFLLDRAPLLPISI